MTPEEELTLLREIIGNRELDVISIGTAGYMVARSHSGIVAEAPWVLVDFDDTAADTTSPEKSSVFN